MLHNGLVDRKFIAITYDAFRCPQPLVVIIPYEIIAIRNKLCPQQVWACPSGCICIIFETDTSHFQLRIKLTIRNLSLPNNWDNQLIFIY